MKLLAVRAANFTAFISLEELNPNGRALEPKLTSGMVSRYGFLKFPQTIQDYLTEKGAIYEQGHWNGVLIQKVAFFSDGIVVETRASTEEAEQFFDDLLKWAVSELGVTYAPEMISRKLYLSQLVVSLEKSLNAINPKFANLADRIRTELAYSLKNTPLPPLEAVVLTFGFETRDSKLNLPISVERLTNAAFGDNKFFSHAPLQTERHLALLETFEEALT